MRKLIAGLGFLALFLMADAAILWFIEPTAFSSLAAMRQAGTEALAQILVRTIKMRLTLPQRIDDMTRLENIRAEGNKVIYDISVTAGGGSNFHRIAREIGDNMNTTACDREDYRKLLAHDLAIVINLTSATGPETMPITITPHMCGLDK